MKDRRMEGETRRRGDKSVKPHLDFRSFIPEILNPEFEFSQVKY